MMTRLTIAVIGGSGFIGTRLTERLLASGHTVRIIDKKKSKAFPELWKYADVRDLEQVIGGCRGCDTIYNLAAEHADNVQPRSLYDDVNIGGAENVCSAAEKLGIKRLIFTSSVAIYGFSTLPLDEESPHNPINDYGRTKETAERVFQAWANKNEDRSLIIVRPTVVFGEGNRGNVYNLIRQISGKFFVMVGAGKNYKSIAYVGNIAAFLEHVLVDENKIGIYNYSDGPDLQMSALVSLVRKTLGYGDTPPMRVPTSIVLTLAAILDFIAMVSGQQFPVSRVRIKKFCANTQINSERAMSSRFHPEYDLTEALTSTITAEFGE